MIFPILKTHWTKSNTNTQKFEEKAILLKMWLATETLYKNDELVVPRVHSRKENLLEYFRGKTLWNETMKNEEWACPIGPFWGVWLGETGKSRLLWMWKRWEKSSTRKLKEEIDWVRSREAYAPYTDSSEYAIYRNKSSSWWSWN